MLNRQQLLLTFLNSGHSPSVLWFMLSLGSVSVWKTPAVLSLYMGCRQTPDASQKRTVPSSCLQTNAQQDIAQSRAEMSQWICFCFLVVVFFKKKRGEQCRPCEQQVSLRRVRREVLASSYWPWL